MRILIAPDKFAGTLSASEAADAMATGWRRVRPDDEVHCLPLADGGVGTLDVVARAVATVEHLTEVAGPRGHAVMARWLLLPDGRALIESAEACGLHLLDEQRRNPRLTTTYGVGQLISAALAAGAGEVIVAIGGTATVDGGAGMATALGHRLLREDGNGVKVGAEFVAAIDRIQPCPAVSAEVVAAADVDAPLLGAHGAVKGFAGQKGAPDDDLPVLESVLERLADVAERDVQGGPWRDLPGSGAGGGLGFGLAAFAGARLVSGATVIADLVGLPDTMANADLVITGEGRIDRWSVRGKVPGAVAHLARGRGIAVAAIAGGSTGEADAAFDQIRLLGEDGLTRAAALVADRAAELAADYPAAEAGRDRP